MKAEYLNKIIEALIELIDEGVYIVDQDGVGKFYNKAMASMEKVNIEDVLGKKFHEAFPDFSLSESTMFEALKKNNPTLRKQQTYKNLYGKEITTINSTIPIIADGKTVAAVEVAKDITNIRKMSDTLLELTEGKREPRAEEDEAQPVGIKRYTFDDIYGENQVFRQVITRAKKAALNDASVFIYGETGTGKELLAQSIHHAGKRKDRPFLAQNCAAIPETLLEGMAEYYSAELSEKVIRGQTENALKGKCTGGTGTIGYKIDADKFYRIDPLVAPLVLEAFQRYDNGEKIVEILNYLNAKQAAACLTGKLYSPRRRHEGYPCAGAHHRDG